jgi:apolipoprotein N-acyltransferase
MKLMRGYRFRREAFRLLQSFLLVFVAAFLVEAMADWARGRSLVLPLAALGLSACVFMLAAAILFAVDAVIQKAEKKQAAPPG